MLHRFSRSLDDILCTAITIRSKLLERVFSILLSKLGFCDSNVVIGIFPAAISLQYLDPDLCSWG
jgi:hypothetical protein